MPLLEMNHISKRFGDVHANNDIHFTVEPGEVHTLLGENGAGKTTLMNILYGLYRHDEGEIRINGKPVTIDTPHKAIELHIGMIHQHFMLIPRLSVAENIILGLPSARPPFLDLKQTVKKVERIAQIYDLDIDAETQVGDLPVGMQQRVEILKALYRKTDLLILDEPTAVLTPLEVEAFFKIIRRLTTDGLSVIFISHKLNEVMHISDRITVLRKGRVVGTVNKGETSPSELANMMIGKSITFDLEKPLIRRGDKVLEIKHLIAEDEQTGKRILKNISFCIYGGEILGIAGVDGNGQTELADAIAGLLPVREGQILISNRDITHLSPGKRIGRRLGYIPADRQKVGTIMDMSIAENVVLKSFNDSPYCKGGLLLNHKAIDDRANQMISAFDIKAMNGTAAMLTLSGGNQQKVILAREISNDPEVLIAAQPTRGLDVGSIKYVHQCILEHRKRGKATLFISTEIDELIAVSDRVAVMYEGEIMGILPGGKDMDMEQISLMMAGVRIGKAGSNPQ